MNEPAPSPLHQPCALVTGAFGFVGRHLCRSLVLAGVPVVGFGKHAPGEELPLTVGPFTRADAGPELPGAVAYDCDGGRMWYLALDLEEPGPVAELVALLRPASVFHLAAQSSAALSFRIPADTFRANVIGTLHLLEAVRALGEAQRPVVVSVGSCEEYGRRPAAEQPLGEDTPVGPVSPYGVSKVAQTLLCRQYVEAFDLPVVMTRSFSHTGPGQDVRFAFPSFARQIAAAEAGAGPDEILTGDLSAVRDFLDVRDVVAAYRLLAKEGRPGEIYHVSSGRGMTIQDGLEIMIGGAKRPISMRRDEARCRPADIPVVVGDNAKLQRETGWSPERDISETLLGLLDEARKEFS